MSSLPRPVRFAGGADGRALSAEVPLDLRAEFAKPYTDGLLVNMICERVPLLRRVMQLSQAAGESEQILSLLATELAFQQADGVIVELTPTLVELLLNTDLDAAEHLTADDLKLPFDNPIFLRVNSNAPSLMVSGHDQPLPVDGFYLRRTHVELAERSLDGIPAGVYDGLDMVCLSQPVSNGDPLDDAFFHLPLSWSVTDGAISINQIIAQRHEQMCLGRPELRLHFTNLMAGFKPLMEFCLKALLYLNLPEARRRNITEASDLAKRMAGLGPKKRAKLARLQARVYDRVEVGPSQAPGASGAGDASRTVAPHYRRGHFRRQRVGEGREQSRIVWIKPVLVAFSAGLSSAPVPKGYRVRA